MMDNAQKNAISDYNAPSSEPFGFSVRILPVFVRFGVFSDVSMDSGLLGWCTDIGTQPNCYMAQQPRRP
jgi:hypothetical protein